ncbi:MAG: condensation domain-containing protein, partial [Bacteroidota bacterium]
MTSRIQSSVLPLTQNQTAIWLDELLFEKSPMYNIGAYYEIKGPLEVELFAEALRKVVAEHDVFGLSIEYMEDGQACQHFTPQADYRLPVLDFSNQEDAAALCVQWMNAHFQEAFDITQGPLFSFTLLKAGGEHYY